MWEKIGVSLATYIAVIIVYGVISYYCDLDGKLSFFIITILGANLSLDVVKFFLFNISALILSEKFYNKYDSKEKTYSFEEYNKLNSEIEVLNGNYINLEREHKKLKEEYGNLKQNLIIIMQDYSAIFVNSEVRTKIHQKVINHLDSIRNHLSSHEIKALENNYTNIQDIVNNFANNLDQVKSDSFNKIGL